MNYSPVFMLLLSQKNLLPMTDLLAQVPESTRWMMAKKIATMMTNEGIEEMSVPVTLQNKAKCLVADSLANRGTDSHCHTDDVRARYYGWIGEALFCLRYGLKEPPLCYGSRGGKDDRGQDFIIEYKGKKVVVDVKTTTRKKDGLKRDWSIELYERQVNRPDSLTQAYFCIVLIVDEEQPLLIKKAYLIGIISRDNVRNFPLREPHYKSSGAYINERTYEVPFGAFTYFDNRLQLL